MKGSDSEKKGKLTIEHVDPRRLNPSAYNPRKIGAKQMKLLRRSLKKFGFVDPVQVQTPGDNVIGGHQRVRAAILEGLALVPVVRLKLSDSEARLLNLTLNAEYGTVDLPKLTFLLRELKLAGAELDLTGYDAAEIEELTATTPAAMAELDLEPPPSIVWVLVGIPFEEFAGAQESLAKLQAVGAISVQTSRDR